VNIRIRCSEFLVLQAKNKDHKNDNQAYDNNSGPLQDFFKSSHGGWFWSAEYSNFLIPFGYAFSQPAQY